jgi:hypothetical protein
MKNIFVLPTDKPSRLAKHSSGSFHIVANKSHKKGLYNMTNQNIYITSDEEITGKIGFNIKENKIQFFNSHPKYDESGKKIILTTDPQLIADGVQAIDDEFLQWFVKNPSCEKVEVRKIGEEWIYNADVPKEEFKTLPDVNWQSEIINKVWDEEVEESFATQLFSDNSKIIPDYFQPKSHLENVLEQLDNLESTVDEFVENSNEEKLREAGERYESTFEEFSQGTESIDFIAGANLQAERMLTDGDLVKLLDFVSKEYNISNGVGWFHSHESIEDVSSKEVLDKWFEQFKKK